MKQPLIEPLEARIAPAAFTIGQQSIEESDSGVTFLSFSVTATDPDHGPLTLHYSTSDGTEANPLDNATLADNDFEAASGDLVFAAGELSKTFTVKITGDSNFEHDEKFNVTVVDASDQTASVSTTGTIRNDDDRPTITIDSPTVDEGNDPNNPTPMIFTVKLSARTFETITATVATANGTALAGSDYTATNSTLTFAPGETQKTFSVSVIGDTISEGNETVLANLTVTSPTTTSTTGTIQGVGTIHSDDARIEILDATLAEGGGNMLFTVKLVGGPKSQQVTINYATSDGTAISTGPNADYTATSGILTFTTDELGNAPSQEIMVPIVNDAMGESNETFLVKLTNIPAGVYVSKDIATGTITNDDPLVSISTPNPIVEGNLGATDSDMDFNVAIDQFPANATIQLHYHTIDGTAVSTGTVTAGTLDFVASDGFITLTTDANGKATGKITVKVKGDGVTENNEFFNVIVDGAKYPDTIVDGVVTMTGDAIPMGTATAKGTINDNDTTVLTIGDATVVEGDSGQKNAVFLVTLTPSSGSSVTVNFTTNDGTAKASQDYTTKSGTLTFAKGITSQYITVPILGDLVYEGNESFTVKLSSPSSGISIANDTGTGTIQDNDPVPTVSVGPASVYEGNPGDSAKLEFVVKLSNPSSKAVTVRVVTADGTATAGNDYTALTMPNPDPDHAGEFLPYQEITFAPGETTKSVFVDVTGDADNEADETMSVQLVQVTDPAGATLSPTASTAIGTIQNDEIIVSIDEPVIFIEGAADGSSLVTIRLDKAPAPGASVTVNFVLEGLTAKLNDDIKLHDPTMMSVTFEGDVKTKTIAFDVIDDTISEGGETFKITLSSVTGALIPVGNVVRVGTINDNGDPLPTVKILDAQITEGDSGTKDMTFTVKLTEAAGQPVTVRVATEDGTAIAGAGKDYIALASPDPMNPGQTLPYQEITFAAGETEKTVTVKILGDDVDEPVETFKVKISDATPIVVIGDAEAVGTITDNDLRALSIADSSAPEGGGTMKFTISLAKAATQDVTVFYTTVDGTAKAGTDYTTTTGTLTFHAGDLTQTIDVPIINDNGTAGPDKTFAVALSNPTNATIADNKANGTILDDESYYTLEAVSGPSINEAGATTVVFKVTRHGFTSQPGTVTYTTVDGTAQAGTGEAGDYTKTSGTLNFAAGDLAPKMVSVTVHDDIAHENSEDFLFTLTGSTGGVLKGLTADPVPTLEVVPTLSAKTTIIDNDAAPTISVAKVSKAEGTPLGTALETTDFTFTVSLSAADETKDVTVTFETIDGTGVTGAISSADSTRPADFNRVFATQLTIPMGSLSATFVVQVLRDSVIEGNETFTVKLSNPMGDGETFAPGGDLATGTIENDDQTPTISFDKTSLTVVEGNAGQTPATFTLKLNKASEVPVTVTVDLVPPVAGTSGNATVGKDFLDNGVQTVTFAPGETSKDLTYFVLGDNGNEPNETFTVKLSNPQNGTFGSATTIQATATIKNDDFGAVLKVSDASVLEGNSGETPNLVFTVTLENESGEDVTVDYSTADIGAFSSGPSQDYHAVSGTLTFAPGEHTKTVSVPIIGDDFKEGSETLSLKLSNPTNATIGTGFSTAIGTIVEDGDTSIGVSIGDVQIVEGDINGTKTAVFTVSLSAASGGAVTVDVNTRNGTAVAGSDYTAQTKTLTFAAGETTKSFNVALTSDKVFEGTESFFVDVKNPTGGAVVRDGEGRGTIYNDDLQIVNGHTVRYVDTDGDLATVHISKGRLTTTGPNPVLNFTAVNAIGGRTLQMIDFTSNRVAFNHTDVSVTADLQPGFSASGGKSDGLVNVGQIRGGIAIGDVFQIFDNIDFGNVVVEGDLGKIVAGDQVATDRAIQSLSILSHGALGSGTGSITGAPDNFSIFLGGAVRISVGGDVNGVLESVGGDTGDIQKLTIKGALRGSTDETDEGSGQVFVTGTLKNAVIGSIVGGPGRSTGTVVGNFTNDATQGSGASIGKIHVLGDIIGGTGANSGRIFAPNINTVTVDGNLQGNSGSLTGVIQVGIPSFGGNVGKVQINGDVIGGSGANSGEIFASKKMGSVVVNGSLLGGSGADSGSIVTDGKANSVKVLKNIVGDAGERSGTVQTSKNLEKFQLGTSGDQLSGNLTGGKGASSGSLQIGSDLARAASIFGTIQGGSGKSSGGLNIIGKLAKLTIGGDLIGGSTNTVDVTTIQTSGYISANQIGSLEIIGDIISGTKANPSNTISASGTIRAFGNIGSLSVDNIVGNTDVPVVIAAAGAVAAAKNRTIDALTVRGNSINADIFGGYGQISEDKPLGAPLNPDAQMGTIKFMGSVEATNVVAGIDAGDDGRFGTNDDEVITGGSTDNAAVRSRIAAIIISGEVKTNSDKFGVVAQIIGAATVGGTKLALDPKAVDNIELGGTGTNFFLHEVGLS